MSVKGSSKNPRVGDKAPDFSLQSHAGEKITLSSLRGAPVIVYFYPKDNTPGCTTEAVEFRDATKALRRAKAQVVGISPDSVESHCKFAEKLRLDFPLLADADHRTASAYGMWVKKNMYGRTYWGVQRATVLIGPDGTIAKMWPKVRPAGHAAEVLRAVEELFG